ncbi:MAG: hypothetical protein ABSH50_19080 [Bryobacteraceae bacterium]
MLPGLLGASEPATAARLSSEQAWELYCRAGRGASIDLHGLLALAKDLQASCETPEIAALIDCLLRDLSPESNEP